MAQIRDYVFTLSAGVPQYINTPGYFWSVTQVSGGSDIQLSFDSGPWVTRNEGMGGGGSFQQIGVKSSVSQTVTISIAVEQGAIITDQRSTVNATVNTTIQESNTVTSAADVTVAATSVNTVAAARADRKYLAITNKASNTLPIRLNESAVGADQGVELGPGETCYWPTTAAVYAYNPGGSAVVLGVAELRYL